jgi:hypothetical protein
MLRVKSFLPALSWGIKSGFIITNQNPNDNPLNGDIHPLLPRKSSKSAPSAGKFMLTLFWDTNGPILKHYREIGETVNSVRYSTMLEEKLKPAICRNCHRLLSKGIPLLHNHA